jgi:hypothetical protein
MAFVLPHLHSGWAVDQAIVEEQVKSFRPLKFANMVGSIGCYSFWQRLEQRMHDYGSMLSEDCEQGKSLLLVPPETNCVGKEFLCYLFSGHR